MGRSLVAVLMLSALLVTPVCAAAKATPDGRVTVVVHDVSLIGSNAPARPAILNERVADGMSVRTGNNSRSELTWVDQTITRLGANTFFSFTKSGREVELQSGSTLLRMPKDSGGARILTSAVTAGITGTTIIFETTKAGRSRLTVLEGNARLALVKQPRQTRVVMAGQILDVSANAIQLPEPTAVDLDRLMKTSPLVLGFAPLPSRDLIGQAIRQQREDGPANQNGRDVRPAPPTAAPPPGAQPPPPPGPR